MIAFLCNSSYFQVHLEKIRPILQYIIHNIFSNLFSDKIIYKFINCLNLAEKVLLFQGTHKEFKQQQGGERNPLTHNGTDSDTL